MGTKNNPSEKYDCYAKAERGRVPALGEEARQGRGRRAAARERARVGGTAEEGAVVTDIEKILLVPDGEIDRDLDGCVEKIGAYFTSDGAVVLEPLREMDLAEFMAIGRVEDCDCGHIQCCCEVRCGHDDECRFRQAATCAVPIACESHGRDVCPVCDPCTCERR